MSHCHIVKICNLHFEILNLSQFSTGNILDNLWDETSSPSLPIFLISNNNIITLTIYRLKLNMKIKWLGFENYRITSFKFVFLKNAWEIKNKQTFFHRYAEHFVLIVELFRKRYKKKIRYLTFYKRLIVPNKPTQIPIYPINYRNK